METFCHGDIVRWPQRQPAGRTEGGLCFAVSLPSPACASVWKKATAKVLRKREQLGANPQLSAVLCPPFPVKGEEKQDLRG